MPNNQLLLLRKKWFKLKAKEFIERYSSGLIVLVLFLPGVAVGDNFKMLMTAISKPFLLISATSTPFVEKLVWINVLLTVFVVWSRAQRKAIDGGAFTQNLKSLPISKSQKTNLDIKMLLLGNHFLWVFIVASLYFLVSSSQAPVEPFFNYGFLLMLLLSAQYISVFAARTKNFLTVYLVTLTFIIPLPGVFQWIKLVVLYAALILFIKNLFIIYEIKVVSDKNTSWALMPTIVSQNLYYQILFKAGFTSTIFRIGIVSGFTGSLLFLSDHFVKSSNNDLLPYACVLEAFLAYYLSGFYVVFSDERKSMTNLFASLPIKRFFWIVRDIFVIIFMTLVLHGIYFIWLNQYFPNNALYGLVFFNILLLTICFPLRILIKKNQTFISFVVLFIITVITIYNLS